MGGTQPVQGFRQHRRVLRALLRVIVPATAQQVHRRVVQAALGQALPPTLAGRSLRAQVRQQQLIADHPQGVDIVAPIARHAPFLLRRGVVRRVRPPVRLAQAHARRRGRQPRQAAGSGDVADAEVRHSQQPAVRPALQQHVGRLQVAVDDRVRQAVQPADDARQVAQHLQGPRPSLRRSQPPQLTDHPGEVAAVDVLVGQPGHLPFQVGIDQRHDAMLIGPHAGAHLHDPPDDLALVAEQTVAAGRVEAELDGPLLAEERVPHQPHLAEAARSERLHELPLRGVRHRVADAERRGAARQDVGQLEGVFQVQRLGHGLARRVLRAAQRLPGNAGDLREVRLDRRRLFRRLGHILGDGMGRLLHLGLVGLHHHFQSGGDLPLLLFLAEAVDDVLGHLARHAAERQQAEQPLDAPGHDGFADATEEYEHGLAPAP